MPRQDYNGHHELDVVAPTSGATGLEVRHTKHVYQVISRRISQGTRTEQGSLAFALLASVIETCRKRGVPPWSYLGQVVKQRRQGEPATVLPEPAPAP